MEQVQHQHRPDTNFKQSNKSHKTGRHVSKTSIRQKAKGRIDNESTRVSVKEAGRTSAGKLDRRNKGKQAQAKVKDEQLLAKRTGKDKIPRTIAVISLGNEQHLKNAWNMLLNSCDIPNTDQRGPLTLTLQSWKQRVTLCRAVGNVTSALDLAKVADIIMFVLPPEGVDELGQLIISTIKSQGLPSVMGLLPGLESLPLKQKTQVKRDHTKFLEMQFPDIYKILSLDSKQDADQVMRFACTCKVHEIKWRDVRPYMLADKVKFIPNSDSETEKGTILVSGFLRGAAMNVNNLVHLPGVGDFQLKQVDKPTDPYLVQHKKREEMDTESIAPDDSPQTLAVADPQQQETLQAENVPDTFASEQTWPTEEELKEADERMKEALQVKKTKRLVPKGTSAYQAAWLLDSDDDHSDEDDVDESEETANYTRTTAEVEIEHKAIEEPQDQELEEFEELKEDDEELARDAKFTEELMKQKTKESEEDLEFPDEVDTPLDVPARVRFQKYRGLKSFRTSPWDPKENLPVEYSKIYQFQNFNRAKKRILNDSGATIDVGQYVTLHILNVPVTAYGLLKYENKVSVLHFSVMKHSLYEPPIKSKEQLIIHSGFRRYKARPIFSEHNSNCDKHKYERFLHHGRFSMMASVYAPITFPPAPMLMMKETDQGQVTLAATGSLHSVNPDRVILKRIVLTGYPLKVFKRHAVIRQMFFNTADVNWFKPVELHTKYGKIGHILEPLGTHGHMKVQFDTQILQNDTICMYLYKRIFPKWDDWWNGPKSASSNTTLQNADNDVPSMQLQIK